MSSLLLQNSHFYYKNVEKLSVNPQINDFIHQIKASLLSKSANGDDWHTLLNQIEILLFIENINYKDIDVKKMLKKVISKEDLDLRFLKLYYYINYQYNRVPSNCITSTTISQWNAKLLFENSVILPYQSVLFIIPFLSWMIHLNYTTKLSIDPEFVCWLGKGILEACYILKEYIFDSFDFDYNIFLISPNDQNHQNKNLRLIFSHFQIFIESLNVFPDFWKNANKNSSEIIQEIEIYKELFSKMPETDKYRLYRQKRLFYSMKQLVHFGNSHNLSRNELVLFMEHATMLMNVSSWEVTFYFTKLAEHHKNEDMKPEQIHLYTDKIKLWDGIFLILEYIQQNQKKIETILRNYINEDLQKGENVFDNLFIDDLLNKIMYKNRFSMEHVIPEINLLFEHNYWLSLINLLYNMTSFTKYFTSPTLCPKITEFCSMDPLVFEHFPIYMRLVEIFSPFDHTLKQDKSSSQYNKIVGIFHDLCLNPYFIGTKNFYTPPLRIAFLHKKLGQVKKPNELSEEIKSIQTIRTFMEVANLFFRNSYEKQILLQKVAFSTLSSHLHAWCNNFNSLNRKKKQEIDLPASLYYFIRHWTSYHYELYVQSSVSVKEAVKMAIYQNSTDSNSNGEGNKVIRVIYHYKSYINSLINSDLHELEYCPSLKSFKSEEKLHSFLNYQNLYDLSKLVGPEGMCMISKTVNEEVKREIQQLFNLYIYIAKIAKRKNQNILNFDHIKDLPGNIELIPLIRTFAQIGNLLFLMEIIKSVVQTFIQNEKPCLFIKLKNHIGQRKTSGSDVISSSSTSNRLSGSNSPTNSPKERNLSRESNSNEESSSSKESNVSEKPNSTLSYEEKIMDLLDENSKIIFENSDELQFAKKVCMFIPLLIFNAVENDTEVQEDGQKGDNLFKKTLKKDNKTKDNSHIIIKNQMNSIIRGIDETISLIRKHCIPSQDNEYEIDKIWKFYNYVIQQYIISSQRKNEFAIKFIQTSTLFSQNYYAGALKNDNFPGRISQQHVIPDSLILDVYD